MAKNAKDSPERRSPLAMTALDHKTIGSTAPKVLVDNPGKKLHQLMESSELRTYMALAYMVTAAQYRAALRGKQQEKLILQRAREQFVLDLAYLQEIGRLPEELEDLDPAMVFQLPAKNA